MKNQASTSVRRILIAPNSFKECADSVETAGIFQKYLDKAPCELYIAPLSDGGDGFLRVCTGQFNLEMISYTIPSPINTPVNVIAGYERANNTVYIESADVIGLKLIPPGRRNPMHLSSAGMGKLLQQISADLPVERFKIGIGGTGINDLGLGMISELGVDFYDHSGSIIDPLPENFEKITDVEVKKVYEFTIELITDVLNPLTGQKGATATFGPQKGLSKEDVKLLERQFERLTTLFMKKDFISKERKLSGAGGGLAAGLQLFFNAKIESSSEFILNDLELKEKLKFMHYVITGEGSFDSQSLDGKATGIIIQNTGLPLFLVCGKIDRSVTLPLNVIPIELQKYFSSAEESIRKFENGIKKGVEEIIHLLK
jgi:glycerate 2-kinase